MLKSKETERRGSRVELGIFLPRWRNVSPHKDDAVPLFRFSSFPDCLAFLPGLLSCREHDTAFPLSSVSRRADTSRGVAETQIVYF